MVRLKKEELFRYERIATNKVYTPKEFRASLVRAFGDKEADYIVMDGHQARSRFLRECSNWGLDEGLLWCDEVTSKLISDEQWTTLCYRLTKKGRKEIIGG